jgi:molybdenum cofactor synthesis domain-containing protein
MELSAAAGVVSELTSSTATEWVGLEDASGRVLAENVKARHNLPREARSRLDGYAVRSLDTAGASAQEPVSLTILPGTLAAGHVPHCGIGPAECIRIFTGSPLPSGSDAVVAQEKVHEADGRLILNHSVTGGQGLSLPGEDIREGELLLSRGDLLTPTRLALIAALGYPRIPVFTRPRVALAATGDEVRELGAVLDGPWTFCNNRHLLAWLVSQQGGIPVHSGIVGDDPHAIADRLSGLDANVVITTGGTGRGGKDCISEAWKLMGVQTHFSRINLTPGKMSALGSAGGRMYWGLPGNPWAAQVVFNELIAPSLWRLQGLRFSTRPALSARLETPVRKNKGSCKAVRGVLDMSLFPPSFAPSLKKGESLFATIRNSFGYILLESHVVEVAAGEEVPVHMHDLPLVAAALWNGVFDVHGQRDRSSEAAQASFEHLGESS